MGEDTKIQWADHTWNLWRGCDKVAPECDNCYAEALSKRNPGTLGVWGSEGKRAAAARAYRLLPLQWEMDAMKAGERRRVFCLSLGDWLEDRPELVELRNVLFSTIAVTPSLDWLLLTKRPGNWRRLLEAGLAYLDADGGGAQIRALIEAWLGGMPPPNVWAGVSAGSQETAERLIPDALRIPAPVHFLSCEPMLGPVNLRALKLADGVELDALTGFHTGPAGATLPLPTGWLDWVICGGESGPNARPFDIEWARDLFRQTRVGQQTPSGVLAAFFMKQVGAVPMDHPQTFAAKLAALRNLRSGAVIAAEGMFLRLKDHKGGDPAEWPEDIRVRELPEAR